MNTSIAMVALLLSITVIADQTETKSKDCTSQVEKYVTDQYPYPETMTMEIKKLGNANVGHRFEGRFATSMDVYAAGTSDEGGGYLYLVTVDSVTCSKEKVTEIQSQDD